MHPANLPPQRSALTAAALNSTPSPDDGISDEEANAEIEIPGTASVPTKPTTSAGVAPEDITPSVRQAVDKAAEVLRQLRDQ